MVYKTNSHNFTENSYEQKHPIQSFIKTQSINNTAALFTHLAVAFYAGLFVIPFLVILAGTGLGMIILSNTVGKQGELISVSPQNTSMAVSHQAHIATSNIAGGQVTQYIAPKDDHHAAAF